MPNVKMPEIVAREVSKGVLIDYVGDMRVYQMRDVGYNMCPLPKTWYEEEFDCETTRTLRFAKRSDHTGLLIQIDKSGFYGGFIDIP